MTDIVLIFNSPLFIFREYQTVLERGFHSLIYRIFRCSITLRYFLLNKLASYFYFTAYFIVPQIIL